MIIRTVTEKDAHELLEIYRPYVEDTAITFEYDVPSVEEFSDRIRRISANYPYIAAVENGKIAGYAYAGVFKNRAAYDWSVEVTVYVNKGLHRKGIGAKLYSALEKLLAAQHITNLYACVAYPEKEDEYLTFDSVKFHEKMGYRAVGKFTDCAYKLEQWLGMIWMEKMLGTHENPPKCYHMVWLEKILTQTDTTPLPVIPFSQLDKALINKIVLE